MSVLQVCEWLEQTSIGVMVTQSIWGFPILVALHIFGLTLSVRVLLWFDLRLVGVSMLRRPVSLVYRRLMPWFLVGFGIMFVTGGLLFIGFATLAYGNIYFRLKMAAILLAGVNALAYHSMTERHIARWDELETPPRPVRLAGFISIALWVSVIMAGRMMSYTMFLL